MLVGWAGRSLNSHMHWPKLGLGHPPWYILALLRCPCIFGLWSQLRSPEGSSQKHLGDPQRHLGGPQRDKKKFDSSKCSSSHVKNRRYQLEQQKGLQHLCRLNHSRTEMHSGADNNKCRSSHSFINTSNLFRFPAVNAFDAQLLEKGALVAPILLILDVPIGLEINGEKD